MVSTPSLAAARTERLVSNCMMRWFSIAPISLSSAATSSEVSVRMTDLPIPDVIAAAHSDRLRQLLTERIRTQGLLSFAQYMEQVLYEPGLGYYMAGAAKFGAEGDFVTAPEVSPLFGAALANEIRGIRTRQGGDVLELGAGNGKLASSILQALSDDGEFTYSILEPSAELVHRQQQLLRNQLDEATFKRVSWMTTLPGTFSGVIIANEVMDAPPVRQAVWTRFASALT